MGECSTNRTSTYIYMYELKLHPPECLLPYATRLKIYRYIYVHVCCSQGHKLQGQAKTEAISTEAISSKAETEAKAEAMTTSPSL